MNRSPQIPRTQTQGIALVLVLIALVLLSTLVLAFLGNVTTERVASESHVVSLDARRLADSALNVVIGQIRDATSQPNQAWISQPGLLRTFDTQGQPVAAYKLYSAAQLRDGDTFDPISSPDRPPAQWDAQPGLFTDLNAPVLVPSPTGSVVPDSTRPQETFAAVYPIVSPEAAIDYPEVNANPDGVRGFSLGTRPTTTFDTNPAPMPVRWLYVLQDGTLAPAQPRGSGAQTTVGDPSDPPTIPTRANPIVGRLAFWTDDDTCKVNINTASGDLWNLPLGEPGTFASMPRTTYDFDRETLARRQPANKEFQRYPGHPATTHLSAVFPKLNRTEIALLAPRVVAGGSVGGTVITTASSGPPPALTPDSDRLYASTDELLYAHAYGGEKRDQNPVTPAALERARFFLTAHNRAPEVTLFNTPRVALWPLWSDKTKWTAFDKLAAYCSTIGREADAKGYYFTRKNAKSPTEDWGTLPRNQEVYAYLQKLTSQPIPGFGGNFLTKYGPDRDQILTEIFDYVRATNSSDISSGATSFVDRADVGAIGASQIIPIQIGATRGVGRFPTISQCVLLFVRAASDPNKGKIQPILLLDHASVSQGMPKYSPDFKVVIRGFDRLAIEDEATGVVQSMGFLSEATSEFGRTLNGTSNDQIFHHYGVGGLDGFVPHFRKRDGSDPSKTIGSDPATSTYKLHGKVLTLPNTAEKFVLRPEDGLIIEIRTNDATSTLLQTLHFNFPRTTCPMPSTYYDFNSRINAAFRSNANGNKYPQNLVSTTDTLRAITTAGEARGDLRLIAARQDVPATLFGPHANYGNATNRVAHDLRMPNSLPMAGHVTSLTDYVGKLVNTVPYAVSNSSNKRPLMPGGLNDALLKRAAGDLPGDWDTGMADYFDGPFINRADEGALNVSKDSSGNNRVPYFSGQNIPSGTTLFSPNRQIPSAAILGSLPTGAQRGLPWQTLLFCPHPAAGNGHPGRVSPPDHLWLDLFNMPVVEPYAISEPFSTDGKVNLNYQMVPFDGYLRRATGLAAIFKSTRVTALPASFGATYKTGTQPPSTLHHQIDIDKTLEGFERRFTQNKPFKSGSEICEMSLIPKDQNQTVDSIATWWRNTGALTGDNLREKPYADLYGRVTTKSNAYTIHVRAQALKKLPAGDPAQWEEGRDLVSSEYRGSFAIERFLDPNLRSYDDTGPLPAYQFRVLETKQFAP